MQIFWFMHPHFGRTNQIFFRVKEIIMSSKVIGHPIKKIDKSAILNGEFAL